MNINQFERDVWGMTEIINCQQNKMIQDIKKVCLKRGIVSDLKQTIRSEITPTDSEIINRILGSYTRLLDSLTRSYEIQNEYFHESLLLQKQISDMNIDVRFLMSQAKLKR